MMAGDVHLIILEVANSSLKWQMKSQYKTFLCWLLPIS